MWYGTWDILSPAPSPTTWGPPVQTCSHRTSPDLFKLVHLGVPLDFMTSSRLVSDWKALLLSYYVCCSSGSSSSLLVWCSSLSSSSPSWLSSTCSSILINGRKRPMMTSRRRNHNRTSQRKVKIKLLCKLPYQKFRHCWIRTLSVADFSFTQSHNWDRQENSFPLSTGNYIQQNFYGRYWCIPV